MFKPKIHYAIIIAALGTLVVFACLGIGRFTIGMILPSMSESLKLNYSQMGIISAGNFSGYLSAVLLSSFFLKFVTPRIIISIGLFLICGSMLLMSYINSYLMAFGLYTITGFCSGSVNVPIMSLVKNWFVKEYRGKAAGVIAAGSGFAIMLSGWLIPFINANFMEYGWRLSWRILAAIVFFCAAISAVVFRNKPEDMGISAYGVFNNDKENTDKNINYNIPKISVYKNLKTYYFGIIYALFGFTYSVYVTFVVTFAVKELNYSEYTAGKSWFFIGLFSILSGPVFGGLSDKFGRKAGFITVFSLQTISYSAIVLSGNSIFFWLSVILFGVTAWSIPAIMTAVVSDNYSKAQMPAAFGFITFIFGLGQISGPLAGGKLAEYSGSFKYAFIMIAVSTLTAVFLSAFYKPVHCNNRF